jgi:KaiC
LTSDTLNTLAMEPLHIPTGCPPLDDVCGGGIPTNSLIYLYGGPGLGKTTLALNTVKVMGAPSIWIDCMHTLSYPYASFEGVSPDVIIIYPTTPHLDVFLPLIGVSKVVVIDDLTANPYMPPKGVEVFLKDIKELLPGSGTSVLITNQVRVSGKGTTLPPGSRAYTKYADLVLSLGPQSQRDGARLTVPINIIKSTVGPYYGQRYITFMRGLDKRRDVLLASIKAGIVKQSGSWYYYLDYKAQGLDNFESGLSEIDIETMYQTTRNS